MPRLALIAPLTLMLTLPACSAPNGEKEERPANRLADESSPYLLQHAHNPVNWYPWGEEAFEKAKKENKIVFLSIGYSSCHWCHVMERESFQNEKIAEILNKHFVAIKVDREERPDIDDIYMTSLQVLGQNGGWPLSMFLTPDGKPIIGGTYWPPEDKELQGQKVTGFKTILETMVKLWKDDRDELVGQADRVAKAARDYIDRSARAPSFVTLDEKLIKTGVDEYRGDIDPVHGGIGRSAVEFRGTKFPMPSAVNFLWSQTRDNKEMSKLLDLTLQKMAEGGIYDQLGGGFHRYSTERTWTVPHFEKMLYDNAQLLEVYARAYQEDPKPLYQRVIDETITFLDREMISPQGAFYSALDADTNEKEGEFYVWTAKELDEILTEQEATILKTVYGADKEPNFEEKYHILTVSRPLDAAARINKIDKEDAAKLLDSARRKLFEARSKRERPFLDTKVLTAWNGQMIAGLAAAGQALDNPDYIKKAEKAADFILKTMRKDDGRLMRTYRQTEDGEAVVKLNGYLEDYAFLIHGLLNLHDATDEKRWLTEAESLAGAMIKWHYDEKNGGFYFTSHDHEKLFARSKDHYDGAQPSGNSMAALDLVRLWKKTGEEQYHKLAEKTFKQFGNVMQNEPRSVPMMLVALDLFLDQDDEKEEGGLGLDLPDAAGPRKSDSVVTVTAKAGEAKDGKQPINISITMKKPWHIYANPVGSETLEGADTGVEVRADGKKLPAKVTYPKGKLVKDPNVGDYYIYVDTITITAEVDAERPEGPLEVRVQLQACNDAACLLPAVVKVPLK